MTFRLTALAILLLTVPLTAVVQAPEDLKTAQADLLDCRAQVMGVQAAILRGTWLTAEQWKTKFEQANPGKTLDAGGKVIEKPPSPEKP
jgi:hypothetical protein